MGGSASDVVTMRHQAKSSFAVDTQFICRIGESLARFSKKAENIYNFRCPFCGDSARDEKKSRGYLFRKPDAWMYKCHNCGHACGLRALIECVNPAMAKEYNIALYRHVETTDSTPVDANLDPNVNALSSESDDNNSKIIASLMRIVDMPMSHAAVQYLHGRAVLTRALSAPVSDLFYTANVQQAFSFVKKYEGRLPRNGDHRIVIPFRDVYSKIFGVTCRSMSRETPARMKYVTVRFDDESPLVYGIDRITPGRRDVMVFEGQFDSMFLDPAVAAGGSNFQHALAMYVDPIVVLDNQPRNVDVVRNMRRCASDGLRVVVWPNWWEWKDVNEAVLCGMTTNEVYDTIYKHAVRGAQFQIEFNRWHKIAQ